jgi:chaperonin GroES
VTIGSEPVASAAATEPVITTVRSVFLERSKCMKIRPLADKLLVQRLEAENKTAGGIVLPDTAKEKPQRGKVVSVGEGKLLDDGTRRKLQVKKGDTVLFTSYAGTDIKIDGKEYLIMDESDVLAVIET